VEGGLPRSNQTERICMSISSLLEPANTILLRLSQKIQAADISLNGKPCCVVNSGVPSRAHSTSRSFRVVEAAAGGRSGLLLTVNLYRQRDRRPCPVKIIRAALPLETRRLGLASPSILSHPPRRGQAENVVEALHCSRWPPGRSWRRNSSSAIAVRDK